MDQRSPRERKSTVWSSLLERCNERGDLKATIEVLRSLLLALSFVATGRSHFKKQDKRRAAHAHQVLYCWCQVAQRDYRGRLAIVRWDGVPVVRSGAAPNPKWAIGTAAAGAASAHHRASAAAPLPTLHQVVRRAVQPATLFKPRALFPGAFSGQVPGSANQIPSRPCRNSPIRW